MSENNQTKRPGLFVVFEGIDGAGKTTQLKLAAEALRAQGYDVLHTREPGGTAIAEAIRALVIGSHGNETFDGNTELLLMFAARNQHMINVIRPAIEKGTIVLCDRFVNSSYVYQVVGNNANPEMFYYLVATIVGNSVPNHTIILDLSEETSYQRSIVDRGVDISRWDAMDVDRRKEMNSIVRKFGDFPNHTVLDAEKPIQAVHDEVMEKLNALVNTSIVTP